MDRGITKVNTIIAKIASRLSLIPPVALLLLPLLLLSGCSDSGGSDTIIDQGLTETTKIQGTGGPEEDGGIGGTGGIDDEGGIAGTGGLDEEGGIGGSGGPEPNPDIEGQALLGPVIGATVKIFDIEDLTSPTCQTITSESATYENAGKFFLNPQCIEDNKLYLIEVSGGSDIDVDDDYELNEFDDDDNNNGVIDGTNICTELKFNNEGEEIACEFDNYIGLDGPEPVQGTFRSVILGIHLKSKSTKVSSLTEYAYEAVQYLLLNGESQESITAILNRISRLIIKEDLNGDNKIDAQDFYHYNPQPDSEDTFIRDQIKTLTLSIIADKNKTKKAIKEYKSLIKHVDTLNEANTIKLKGDIAYIATENAFIAIDISTPKASSIVAWHATGSIKEFVLGDTLAYILLAGGGLDIVDISDPSTITFVKHIHNFKTSVRLSHYNASIFSEMGFLYGFSENSYYNYDDFYNQNNYPSLRTLNDNLVYLAHSGRKEDESSPVIRELIAVLLEASDSIDSEPQFHTLALGDMEDLSSSFYEYYSLTSDNNSIYFGNYSGKIQKIVFDGDNLDTEDFDYSTHPLPITQAIAKDSKLFVTLTDIDQTDDPLSYLILVTDTLDSTLINRIDPQCKSTQYRLISIESSKLIDECGIGNFRIWDYEKGTIEGTFNYPNTFYAYKQDLLKIKLALNYDKWQNSLKLSDAMNYLSSLIETNIELLKIRYNNKAWEGMSVSDFEIRDNKAYLATKHYGFQIVELDITPGSNKVFGKTNAPTYVEPDNYFDVSNYHYYDEIEADLTILGLSEITACYTINSLIDPVAEDNQCSKGTALTDSKIHLAGCDSYFIKLFWNDNFNDYYTFMNVRIHPIQCQTRLDSDGDGVFDNNGNGYYDDPEDNCQYTFNPNQDEDGDGIGDVCEHLVNNTKD